jgi:hypothetical protein
LGTTRGADKEVVGVGVYHVGWWAGAVLMQRLFEDVVDEARCRVG